MSHTSNNTTFDLIVAQALRQGLIDSIKVMYWFSNETPQDVVVREIADLARMQRAGA